VSAKTLIEQLRRSFTVWLVEDRVRLGPVGGRGGSGHRATVQPLLEEAREHRDAIRVELRRQELVRLPDLDAELVYVPSLDRTVVRCRNQEAWDALPEEQRQYPVLFDVEVERVAAMPAADLATLLDIRALVQLELGDGRLKKISPAGALPARENASLLERGESAAPCPGWVGAAYQVWLNDGKVPATWVRHDRTARASAPAQAEEDSS
jgi:hypothetical protein